MACLETEPNTFCGGQRIYLFIHLLNMLRFICGTNNLDHDERKIIVDGIIKVDKVFQEKLAPDVKIILTGLLLQELNKSYRKNKILKVNSNLKNPVKMKPTYTT